MINNEETREKILNCVHDLVSDFMYYDRKEDEELPRGSIEQAVKDKVISVDYIISEFEKELKAQLSEL